MVHEEKKVAKIVEELTMFFFAVGAKNISSGIEKQDDQVKITFRSDFLPEYSHNVKALEEALEEPKNAGMEDMYWELAGSGDPGESSQLLLISMMVDRYEMKKEKDFVELVLYKEMLM